MMLAKRRPEIEWFVYKWGCFEFERNINVKCIRHPFQRNFENHFNPTLHGLVEFTNSVL